MDFVKQRMADYKENEISLEESNLHLSNSIKLMEQEREMQAGPLETRLMGVLENLNVERQAFHSNSFVGNHCTTILQNYEALCDVFDDLPTRQKFADVFKVFAEVQPLIRAKRYLNEHEIGEVKRLCYEFGERFPQNFPDSNLTRKMHEHIFHVHAFVEKHRTIGMFSEEEGEALHNLVNQELRQIACVRHVASKYRLLLKRLAILGSADRTCVVPVSRKCMTCVAQKRDTSFLIRGSCPNSDQHYT